MHLLLLLLCVAMPLAFVINCSVNGQHTNGVLQPPLPPAPAAGAPSIAKLVTLTPVKPVIDLASIVKTAEKEVATRTHDRDGESLLEARMAAYPVTAIGTAPNYAAARSAVRFVPGADPGAGGPCVNLPLHVPPLTASYYQPGPFSPEETPVCYMLLADGRVHQAIVQNAIVGSKTNPSAAAKEYCDVLFNPLQTTAAWGPATGRNQPIALSYGMTYARAWQAGHIIAASLGGTNEDPINFFPQHYSINTGGNWQAQEQIGRHLTKAKLNGHDMHIAVSLVVTLNYAGVQLPTALPGATNMATPSGGSFQISIPQATHAILCQTSWEGYGHWSKVKPPPPYAQKKIGGGMQYRPKWQVTRTVPGVTVEGKQSGVLNAFCSTGAIVGTEFVLSTLFNNIVAP